MMPCIVCTNAIRYISKTVWNKLLHATFLAVVRFVTMILIGKVVTWRDRKWLNKWFRKSRADNSVIPWVK